MKDNFSAAVNMSEERQNENLNLLNFGAKKSYSSFKAPKQRKLSREYTMNFNEARITKSESTLYEAFYRGDKIKFPAARN